MSPFSVAEALMPMALSLVAFIRKQIQTAEASEEEKTKRLMQLNAELLVDVSDVKHEAELNREKLAALGELAAPPPAPTAKP